MKHILLNLALLTTAGAANFSGGAETVPDTNLPAQSQELVQQIQKSVVRYCKGLNLNTPDTMACVANGLDVAVANVNQQRTELKNAVQAE